MIENLKIGDIVSGRSVIGDTVHELGMQYDNLFVCTADFGGWAPAFKRDCADRFIDVGIAEQCAVSVAAGLALEGDIPVVIGMSPFLSMRSCEQVRTAVAYQNLPVRIVGTGGGLTSGGGSTHNGMEDIAIMQSMVGMTVISVSDPLLIRDVLIQGMTYPGPIFMRLGQGKTDKVIYDPNRKELFPIGKAITVREGGDATIIAHGEIVGQAMEAADLLAQEGVHIRVLDMFTIKPLDEASVLKAVDETGRILVLEDHLMKGGLASSIADLLMDKGVMPKAFRRLGIPQVYAGFGSSAQQKEKYGYDLNATVNALREMLAKG